MTTKKIRVSDLDYDRIKQSFIDYLKTTETFSDYNYEASGMSTFLNVLAYNSHYQSLMANFLANEMFLDTAVKRSNIVSRAKELGYVPMSRRAAKAVINLTFTQSSTNTSSLILPKGTTFSGNVDDGSFTFSTIRQYSAPAVQSGNEVTYTFNNVEIYEGVLTQNTYAYSDTDYTLTIPNVDVDTTSLKVYVQDINVPNSSAVEFSRVVNFLTIDNESKVYFLQEGFNEKFEIYFGDNIIGYKPQAGSLVEMSYLVTSGLYGNGADNFTLTYIPSQVISSSNTVVTVQAASGGTERETSDMIKFNAINSYGAQNRAVVSDDYKSLIANSGINVKNVLTWGGETNDPPRYGTIMVSVQPLSGDELTISQKNTISDLVKSKAVGNTKIEFVNPEYLDLIVNTNVVFDKSVISTSVYELESAVESTIIAYSLVALSTFNNSFRMSNLQTNIDATDISIKNNVTTVLIERRLYPKLYSTFGIKFSYMNGVKNIKSNMFNTLTNSDCFMEDDGIGNINVYYYNNSIKTVSQFNVGSIDYITGDVQINSITVTSYNNGSLKIVATPTINDVVTSKNVILRLTNDNIKVTSTSDY